LADLPRAAVQTRRPVEWLVAGRRLQLTYPPGCTWTTVKDDLLLRPYERPYAGAGLDLEMLRGATVVDVGAHAGAFSIACACHGAIVHAFEPDPGVLPYLRANLDRNGLASSVRVHPVAVWPTRTVLSLDAASRSGSRHVTGAVRTDGRIGVETAPFDEVVAGLSRVQVLKLDCEGSEFALVQDAAASTLAAIDTIVAEIHAHADSLEATCMIERLRQAGFDVTLATTPFSSPRRALAAMQRWGPATRGVGRLRLVADMAYLMSAADRSGRVRRALVSDGLFHLYARRWHPPSPVAAV